jgi:CubicO group peptidase (beta-lactamase class C family)
MPAPLPRSAPEAQGISSHDVAIFVQEAEKRLNALHSFMLVRHGHVVAEGWWAPYAAAERHMLFSLSKSFAATAVGFAVAEGRLKVTDRLLAFFPDAAPAEPDGNLAAMTLQDLLTMRSGHAQDTLGQLFEGPDARWTRTFLSLPVAHRPGTHFVYNTGATYMVSAVLQRVTGQSLLDYLTPRLFAPLGIESPVWDKSPEGVDLGGFGLSVTTEDIARFGQFHLQRGQWQGRQLLSAAWIEEATAPHADNSANDNVDWQQGYGYQFWRCRHGAYRGDGAFGQYFIVFPEQDAVLAITAGLSDMAAELNLVWEQILPSLRPGPLPADPAAVERLRTRLAALTLPAPKGQPAAAVAAEVARKRYVLAPNDQGLESLALHSGAEQDMLVIGTRRGEQRLVCGHGAWVRGTISLDGDTPAPIAAAGAWTSDTTYVASVCAYQTPFCSRLTLAFADGKVLWDREENVSFGPRQRPQITGQAQ